MARDAEFRGWAGSLYGATLLVGATLVSALFLKNLADPGMGPFYLAVFIAAVRCGMEISIATAVGSLVAGWFLYSQSLFVSASTYDRSPLALLTHGLVFAAVSGALIGLIFKLKRALAEQRLDREGLQTTLTSIAEGVVVTDRRGAIQYLNPVAEALTGWTSQEADGRPFEDVVALAPLADAQPIACTAKEALAEQKWDWLPPQGRLRARNGRECLIGASVAPLCEPSGSGSGLVVLLSDDSSQFEVNAALKQSRSEALRALRRSKRARKRLQRRTRELQREMAAKAAAVTALHESETRLERIVAAAPCVIYAYQVNPDGTHFFPFVSAGMSETFGVPTESLKDDAKVAFERIHPVDAIRVAASIRQSAVTLQAWSADFRILHPDKGELWIAGYSMPARLENGATIWHGALLDITERKLTENNLRLFRTLIDKASDGIEVVDPDSGQLLDVNDNSCAIHGYTREEMLALTILELDPHLTLEGYRANVERLRQIGAFVSTSVHRRKDGSTFPIEKMVTLVKGDKEYCVAIVRDISQRLRTEQSLRESESRFQQVAESIREVFWLVDAQSGIPIYVSPAFERIWGLPAASIYTDPVKWQERIHTDDRIRIAAAWRRCLAAARNNEWQGYDQKYRIMRPDGSIRWVHNRGYPVYDENGALIRLSGSTEDITEVMQLENQLQHSQKMEAFGLLAGGVAHDFNNVLSVISGYSELCLGKLPPDSPLRKALTAIRDAGERGAGLTRQLLAFSRRSVLAPQVVELNALVREIEKMLRRMIGEDIALETCLAADLPHVHLDPGQFGQILMNLAVNARDAMPRGGQLRIETSALNLDADFTRTHLDAKHGRHVCLAFKDTGCGMSPTVKARIFEPFFTTKGVGRGTGLGLAVVHGVIKQSGGFIDVESAVGVGTTFKLYFPAVNEALVKPPSSANLTAVAKGETILLVEDEESLRALTATILDGHGYKVVTASSAEDALHTLKVHPRHIDLLATDVIMPGIGGRELAEKLCAQIPKLKVLFLSGYTDDAILRHGVEKERVAFLQKPYLPADLLKAVSNVLGGH